eukprot:jgi/Chrzof1/872/Cz01g32070.t1
MGDLLPIASTSGALAVRKLDPEKQLAQYELRLKEAQELEEKLQKINEEVPNRIFNVSGSCAGAGSGDFHYYRQIRRAEQDRLRRLEAEYKKKKEQEEFEGKLKQAQQQTEERTAKKRSKRQRKKEKKKSAKIAKTGADGDKTHGDGAASDDDDEQQSDEDEVPQQADLD